VELTKDHPILSFPEVYALKTLKGKEETICYSTEYGWSRSAGLDSILDVLHSEHISLALGAFGVDNIIVFGTVYGKKPRFYVRDVTFNGNFLAVPHAKNVAAYLKLPFVTHKKMSTKSLRLIKKYAPVELRPLDEFVMENGERLLVRYEKETYDTTK